MSDAPAPVEAAPAAPRIIPGLGTLAQQKKARSRTKAAKASSARVSSSEDGSHVAVPAQEAQATGKGQGLTLKPESLSVVEPSTEPPKRIPASVLVAKRIKATQKKLQRIYGYKDQTESLNADQQKAVATIPSLEAVIKELQEVVKVLELEESENEKLAAQKAENDEKHTQVKIAQAVHEFKKHTQSDLTLLFQFFHLNSLFSPDQASFVATQLPPVVADATGQEAAAVKTLYDAFANGPLLGGGGDDAFERLQRLTEGHDTDVIEDDELSDGRVKQMTLDLTASPAEIEGDESENQVNGYYESQELRPEQAEAAVEAHANLLQNAPAPSLNFIQVSELEQPAAEAEPAAARSFDDSPQNFTYPPSSEQPAPATTWDEPTTAPETAKPAGQSQAWGIPDSTATKQINSWADDVEAQAEPAFSEPTPATEAPTEPTVTIPDTEAAAPAERGRGRGPRRGGRGGPPPHGPPPHGPPPHHHHHGHTPPPPGEEGERPRRGPPRGGRGGPRGGRPPHGHPPPPPPGDGAPVEDGWNLIHRREVSGEPPRGRGRGRGGRGRGADGEHRGGERGERRGRGRPAPATTAPVEA